MKNLKALLAISFAVISLPSCSCVIDGPIIVQNGQNKDNSAFVLNALQQKSRV